MQFLIIKIIAGTFGWIIKMGKEKLQGKLRLCDSFWKDTKASTADEGVRYSRDVSLSLCRLSSSDRGVVH